MSVAYEHKASSALQQLGLAIAEQQLDQAAQQAAAAGWSYTHSWVTCWRPRRASATKKPCV